MKKMGLKTKEKSGDQRIKEKKRIKESKKKKKKNHLPLDSVFQNHLFVLMLKENDNDLGKLVKNELFLEDPLIVEGEELRYD